MRIAAAALAGRRGRRGHGRPPALTAAPARWLAATDEGDWVEATRAVRAWFRGKDPCDGATAWKGHCALQSP